MKNTHKVAILFTIVLVFLIWAAPSAAEYPEKPIELIIPFGAGGGADIEGRLLAKEMSAVLGQPIVPINKPGAGGAVTYTHVKNAKPDGYTIAWNSTSLLTSTNIGNVSFDYTALDHVGRVEVQPMPFTVRYDSKWKTYNEFVEDCKKAPGTYKVAIGSIGSSAHLVTSALTSAAQCEVTFLPVGIKRRNATLLSGEADAMGAPLTGAIRLVKAKKFRLLVLPGSKREKAIPDVPTAKELGLNVDIEFFRGLSVPKGTPAAIKEKIAKAMMHAAKSDAFTKFSKKKGFTISPLNPTEFEAYLSKQNEIVKATMKRIGIYQSKRKK